MSKPDIPLLGIEGEQRLRYEFSTNNIAKSYLLLRQNPRLTAHMFNPGLLSVYSHSSKLVGDVDLLTAKMVALDALSKP